MSTDQQHSSESGAAAGFILAVLLPVGGLIYGLVVRSSARQQGRPAPRFTTPVIVISSVLTATGFISSAAVGVFLLVAALGPLSSLPQWDPSPAPGTVVSEVVLTATTPEGSRLTDDELRSTRDVIDYRLERAGLQATGMYVGDGRIHVTFDPQADLAAAADALDGELSLDFRPVLEAAACDPAATQTGGPDQEVRLCDADGFEGLLLGPSELTGESVSTATAAQQTSTSGVSTGLWGVSLTFDADGTALFADISRRLIDQPQPRDRFAIVLDGTVLSAPSVQGVVEEGPIFISGAFTEQSAGSLARQLTLARQGLVLRVESTTRG